MVMSNLVQLRLRVAVICHGDEPFGREAIPQWASTSSDLVAVISNCERRRAVIPSCRSEMRRVGLIRMLDVPAIRLDYRVFLASSDMFSLDEEPETLRRRFSATCCMRPT